MYVNAFILTINVLLLAFAQNAYSQDSQGTESESAQNELPIEILVTPTMSISDLKQLIITAEEDLFGKFNEMNDDDDYAIDCHDYIPTGTHIPRRVCVPKFLMDLRAETSADSTFSLGTDDYGSPFHPNNRGMVKELTREYEILQEKMEEFAAENAEFRQSAVTLIELQRALSREMQK